MDFNRRLSESFTRKIGFETDDRSSFVKGVNYFPYKLKEIIILCQKKIPNESLKVLDVGCGRFTHLQSVKDPHPLITPYGMDIAMSELKKNGYLTKSIVHDACSEHYRDELKEYKGFFHIVISHNFLEHVSNPEITHSMIHYLLAPKGFVVHAYPTLYDPIMFLGHLLPTKLAEKIVSNLEPWRGMENVEGKFKTYYRKCRCDSKRMRRWFDTLGFDCLEYRDYYGTAYCFAIFPVQWILDIFYLLVMKLNIGLFSSRAIVTLQKKEQESQL